jgi:hypothetical protein
MANPRYSVHSTSPTPGLTIERYPRDSEIRRRLESCIRIAEALTFQVDHEAVQAIEDAASGSAQLDPAQLELDYGVNAISSPLKESDRKLVAESIACEVDVLLTLDNQLRRSARRIRLPLNTLSPTELIAIFERLEIDVAGSDHADHRDCPYQSGLICDDTEKWHPLFAILEGGPG